VKPPLQGAVGDPSLALEKGDHLGQELVKLHGRCSGCPSIVPRSPWNPCRPTVLPLYCRYRTKERRVSQAHQRCLAALRPGTVCGHTRLAMNALVGYASYVCL
jgi:hypothetical protein